MSTFPQLKTGAVGQYPAHRSLSYSTRVVQFLDSTEQRFRDYHAPVHRWIIPMDRLDEAETAAIEEFFASQQGQYGDFSFTDPWDGTEYPSCSLESDAAVLEQGRQGHGKTILIVRENRS